MAGVMALLLMGSAQAAPLKVCLVSGSFEYDSDTALGIYKAWLETHYDVSVTMISADGWTQLPGIEALDDCDVALFYTRRLRIEGDTLEKVKAYLTSGRPFVAVRTASHGFQNWLEFDKEVMGGNYQGHYGEGPTTAVRIKPSAREHPILHGVGNIASRYSLYRNKGAAEDVEVLLTGKTPETRYEPLAWTREINGGRLFYTSLGGVGDFEGVSFSRMMTNALYWTAQREPEPKPLPEVPPRVKKEGALTVPVRARTDDAVTEVRTLPIAKTAIILCDMWDKHWCDFASERVGEMAPRMNEVVKAARDAGVMIIHCPSDTLDFYSDTHPRRRMERAPAATPQAVKEVDEPPLPIDDSDGGCPDDQRQYQAWTRQHSAIEIHDEDGISHDGQEVYNFLEAEGIEHLIFMGVHTNMCILGRSFAIRQMTRWGKDCYLVRDMTDSMYNPALAPHVSHDEGTALVVQHIERYWAPSLLSEDLVAGL
jgi:type 1 glutamine amidotransferase/nicotinamidase-related amidase